MRKLLISLMVIVPLISLFASPAEAWERIFHWNWEPSGLAAGTFFLIPIFIMIAFWVAVIIGIVYFVKWLIATGKRHETKSEDTALDIFEEKVFQGRDFQGGI